MARLEIKNSKKALRAGSQAQSSLTQADEARSAALFLLQRSVRLHHKQLALMRLLDAVKLAAPIDTTLWEHCLAVAASVASAKELRMLNALREQAVHRECERRLHIVF